MTSPRTLGPILLAATFAVSAAPCAAQDDEERSIYRGAPPGMDNVTVEEQLDETIPTDLTFRDHTGRRVTLADVLPDDRPVILTLGYHSCTTFCSVVLDGVAASLNQQAWTVGQDFDVVTISIDPRDAPEDAARSRERILRSYGRDSAREGWHFLVAEQTLEDDEALQAFGEYPSAERLADAVGFRYEWMPRSRQYAHPGVIMMLTPDHRVSRYLYGLEYAAQDVRLGLLESSEGRITVGEQLLLYCYAYNATEQTYTLLAWRIMRIGGLVTAVLLFSFLGLLWWRDRKRHPAVVPTPQSGSLVRTDR